MATQKRFKKVVTNKKTWRKKTVRYWQKGAKSMK